jgi:hypothetical protein
MLIYKSKYAYFKTIITTINMELIMPQKTVSK